MDDKAKEIIEPYSDWDIGNLSFKRVMTAIDAIVESKIERLTNEMKAEIQKLQIEKAFPPKTTNEGENKDEEEKKNIDEKLEESKQELHHLWYCAKVVNEDKRIKTRNKLKEIFGGVIMTITDKDKVNDDFTYSNSDLRTLKKNIRKYIRNLIYEISKSEPLYIYINKNNRIDKPIICYNTRNYKIIPNSDSESNNHWFKINIICENYYIPIPILFFDRNTYFLSVRNTDPKNKSYNFAIVNTKTKESVIFTKDKFVFDDWKLEISLEKEWWR